MIRYLIVAFLCGGVASVSLFKAVSKEPTVNEVTALNEDVPAITCNSYEVKQENAMLRERIKHLEPPLSSVVLERHTTDTALPKQKQNDGELDAASIATIKSQLAVYSVKPVMLQLTRQLALDENRQQAVEKLLDEKAAQDFVSWQRFSQLANDGPDDTDLYQQEYLDTLSTNAMAYRSSLASVLNEAQLADYQAFESEQANLQVYQKQQSLLHAVKSLNLDEYQKSEVTRLSKYVYSKVSDNTLGTSGSPYAFPAVVVDSEKLAEIKAIFTKEQRQHFNL
ncbi:hypothetical protein J8L98_10730 [Pseudoalteromonas sp. MMG013]|uniref:hypothetical protein n=1 Tax=Pseudoalteromonas sp. MMG013 TaxID=2822687 RepID=UPI001B380C92|nr:hypothetical protein [Pseudoalteromonas sp. MMG013]MBQ4862162.1 hypothetical protein [Pseudoalteromonas sp. MMG013]